MKAHSGITIHQPIASMADAAIDILLRTIRQKDHATKVVVDHVVAYQLIKRGSVAPYAAPKGKAARA